MAQIERITENLEKPELDDRSYRVIRLPTHKQQMLHCMGHSWHIIFIGEIANIDIHGGTGLIGPRSWLKSSVLQRTWRNRS
jgi:hypothetical protein